MQKPFNTQDAIGNFFGFVEAVVHSYKLAGLVFHVSTAPAVEARGRTHVYLPDYAMPTSFCQALAQPNNLMLPRDGWLGYSYDNNIGLTGAHRWATTRPE